MIASRRPLLTRYLSAAAGFVGMPPPPIGRKRKTGHPVYFRRQGGPVRSFLHVLFGRSPVPTLAREEASHYSSSPVPETGPTHAGGGSTNRVGFVHHHGEVGEEGGGKEWDGRRLSVPESVRESLLQRAPERKGGREGDKLRRASPSPLLVMLAPCWPRVNKREREEEQSRQNSGEEAH